MLSALAAVLLAQPFVVGLRVPVSPMRTAEAPAAGNQVFPVVAESGGVIFVAWLDYRVSPSFPAIFATTIDTATGAPVGTNLLVSPRSGLTPAMAGLGDGRVAVGWDDEASSFVRVIDAQGIGPPRVSVPGFTPSLTSYDGGLFLAVANTSTIEGRRLRLDGTLLDTTPIAIGGPTAYAAQTAGAVLGSTLFLASQLSAGVGLASVDLTSRSVQTLPGLDAGVAARLAMVAVGAAGVTTMTQFDLGGSRFDTWNVTSGWSNPIVVGSAVVSASMVGLPDGGVLAVHYEAPFGPRVTAGAPGDPRTLVPTRATDVAVGRAGDRLVFATATSSSDVDLYGLTTGLDWTDGGPPMLLAKAFGAMENPAVAASDANRWLVVWEEPRPGDLSVIAGAFVDALGIPGTTFEIANPGTRPSVAFAAGRFVVGYSWNETRALSVSASGVLGPTAVFGTNYHELHALAVDEAVWFLYPTPSNTLEVGRYHSDGGSSRGPVVTSGSSPLVGAKLARRASGGFQAVWLEGSTDVLRTALLDAQGIAGGSAPIAAGVSGARPIVQAIGDDLIVATYLGSSGLRLMRLSGTTVTAQRTLPIGRSFTSTLGLSMAATPADVMVALSVEGTNTLQLLPLDTRAGGLDAGGLIDVDSEALPLAGTAMAMGTDRLLLAHRLFDGPSASMRLWVRTLRFPSDGGAVDGGGDAGGSDGGDSGVNDGGADAGEVDAGALQVDGGGDAGSSDAGASDGGDAGAIDGGEEPSDGGASGRRSFGVGCSCDGAGAWGLAALLLFARRRRGR